MINIDFRWLYYGYIMLASLQVSQKYACFTCGSKICTYVPLACTHTHTHIYANLPYAHDACATQIYAI